MALGTSLGLGRCRFLKRTTQLNRISLPCPNTLFVALGFIVFLENTCGGLKTSNFVRMFVYELKVKSSLSIPGIGLKSGCIPLNKKLIALI